MNKFHSEQPVQGSTEWFAQRRGRVTGSNVGAILGLNPYRTAEDVMRAMVREYHGAESEFTGNVATQHGSFHESGAQIEYEMESGYAVQPCGFFVHPEHEWLGASPDGLIGDDVLIEIKCPYSKRLDPSPEFKSADEQPHYWAQMQIELACTGRKMCEFFQWAPGGSRSEGVHRDDKWLAWAIPELRKFYARYLVERDSPRCDDHLRPKRAECSTLKAEHMLREYDELGDTVERANERRGAILAELVQTVGERDALVCGRKLTMVKRVGSVRYAEVVKEHCPDVDLEAYRGKASQSWRLT